jgi:hypothetical protein
MYFNFLMRWIKKNIRKNGQGAMTGLLFFGGVDANAYFLKNL